MENPFKTVDHTLLRTPMAVRHHANLYRGT
jgi:hypothetical protein